MAGSKSYLGNQPQIDETTGDGEEKLLLIDDARFVSEFAEAGQRQGKRLLCIQCLNPTRSLRALLLLLDETRPGGEPSWSVGFCCDCYGDLNRRLFHDAVLRASKPSKASKSRGS